MPADKTIIALTPREVATVLAALRYTARCFERDKVSVDEMSDSGLFDESTGLAPTPDYMDDLAERINLCDLDVEGKSRSCFYMEMPALPAVGFYLPEPVMTSDPYPALYQLDGGEWVPCNGRHAKDIIVPAPSLARWAAAVENFGKLRDILDGAVDYELQHHDRGASSAAKWQLRSVDGHYAMWLDLGSQPEWLPLAQSCVLVPTLGEKSWSDAAACHPSVLV